MHAARLPCVALEHQIVVLEPGHELNDIDPAFEGEIRERSLRGVVSLEEEDELRTEVVEQPLPRDRRGERLWQELG